MPRFQVNACIVTAILVGWAVLVGFVPPIAAGMRVREDFSGLPLKVGEWTGTNSPSDREVLGQLTTCSILARDYQDSYGTSVTLSIVYGRDLGDFHQPEICMSGSGWKPSGSKVVEIHPKRGEPFKATAVTLTNDLDQIVMVYWFYMAGKLSPGMGKGKLDALKEGLLGRGLDPSAMVKFTSIVVSDEESSRKLDIKLCEELTPYIVDVVSKPAKYEPSDKALKE